MSAQPSPASSLPPEAPQASALARHHRRLAATRIDEPAWLNAEVARRLGDKLDAILIKPAQWLDWSGHLGGTADVVARRYPQALRWVLETDDGLAERELSRWQAEQEKARPWWMPWKQPAPARLLRQPDQRPPGWPAQGVNMLWANMSLHATADVDLLAQQWHAALEVDGFLMCSGLGPDTAQELRAVYAEMGWGLPTVRFIDMHDLGDALGKAGFSDPVMDMEHLTLTWADAPAMLSEWRTWGGNVALGRFQGCRTPRWRDRLLDALDQGLKRPDGRLGLTLELVYGHAVKPMPKFALQPETRVSLDDMRRMVKGRDR